MVSRPRKESLLGSDKRASKGFFIGSKITQKIAKVDDTLAVAIAGQLSDAEYLIKVAKAERKLHRVAERLSTHNQGISKIDRKPCVFRPKELSALFCGTASRQVLTKKVRTSLPADMSGAITSEDFA